MYTPHEIRAAIRNCNSLAELQEVRQIIFVLLNDCYSFMQRVAFRAEIGMQQRILLKNIPTND